MRLRLELAATPYSARISSFSITKSFNGRIAEASFELRNAPDPINQTECIVYNDDDDTKIFRGIIVKIQRENRSPDLYWTSISCAGMEYLLPRATITHTWTATKPRIILQDAFGEALPDISTDNSTVEDVGSAIDLDAKDLTLDALVKQLAEIAGAEWRITEEMELVFRAVKSQAAAFEIDQASPDGATKFRCRGLKSGADAVNFANRVTVLGLDPDGTELRGEDEDSASITALGPREIVLPMRNLTTQAAVDEAASLILANRLEYLKTIELTLDHGRPAIAYDPILEIPQPGDVLTISAPNQASLSGDFQIQSVKLRQVTPPNPENDDQAWTEVSIGAGDFPGSIVERLRSLSAKAKDGTDGTTTGTTPRPPTTGGPGGGDCGCTKDCCHMLLEEDCEGGFQVRQLAIPVMYLKYDASAKDVYRKFFKNGAWTNRQLVYNSGHSTQNYLSTGATAREAACYGSGLIGGYGSTMLFIGEAVSGTPAPVDITPTGADTDTIGGFSEGRAGAWLVGDRWYALVQTQVSTVWYVSVIRSAPVTSPDYRPGAAWTIMGTGPNDGTSSKLRSLQAFYDGEDTITIWGRFNGSSDCFFQDFTISTGTWGSAYGTITIASVSDAYGKTGLVKLADGTKVVFYRKSNTNVYFRTYASGSYGSEQQLDENEQASQNLMGACLDPDGVTVHAIYMAQPLVSGTKDWYYKSVVGGVGGAKIAYASMASSNNPTGNSMIVHRGSLIISLVNPAGGSDGTHRAFHGQGGTPPTAFEEMLVDDNSEEPFGGLLGFALDPDAEDVDPDIADNAGEVVARIGPDGATADSFRFGESGDYAIRGEADRRKIVTGTATLSSGAASISTSLVNVRHVSITIKGSPTGETFGWVPGTGGDFDIESDDSGSTALVSYEAIGDAA